MEAAIQLRMVLRPPLAPVNTQVYGRGSCPINSQPKTGSTRASRR